MKTMNELCVTAGLILATAVLAAGTALADETQGVLEVGVARDGGALVAGPAGGPFSSIAQGGGVRYLPVISPDGTRVAFAQTTDRHRALAEVAVVSMAGKELSRTQIEPVVGNLAYAGMRGVEALAWISNDRVVASGEINPSQFQYYVVDVEAGTIVGDFVDDQASPDFSLDGRHVVSLSGLPHFGGPDQSPTLSLDDAPIWSPEPGRSIASAPRFSADGSKIAWVARVEGGAGARLEIWSSGDLKEAKFPAVDDTEIRVRWRDGRVFVTSNPYDGSPIQAWSFDANGKGGRPESAVDPTLEAVQYRTALAEDAAAAGIRVPNFWCASCPLTLLPRSAGN